MRATRHALALGLAAGMLGLGGSGACGADLQFDTVMAQVRGCLVDISRYRGLWTREDAVLLNLPAGGAIGGILISQFYMAPGRNGSEGDYGVVLNAPITQVANQFPELAGAVMLNGRQRRLVSLATETGNPRNRSQTLLVCRGGAGI